MGGKSFGELPQVDLVGAGGVRAHGAQPAGYPQRGETAGRGGPDGLNIGARAHARQRARRHRHSGGCVDGVTGLTPPRRGGPAEAAGPDQHGCDEDHREGTAPEAEIEGQVVPKLADD